MRNFLTCGRFRICVPKVSAVFEGTNALGQPVVYVHLHSVEAPLELLPEEGAPLLAYLTLVDEFETQHLERQRKLMKLDLDRIEQEAERAKWEGAPNV